MAKFLVRIVGLSVKNTSNICKNWIFIVILRVFHTLHELYTNTYEKSQFNTYAIVADVDIGARAFSQ